MSGLRSQVIRLASALPSGDPLRQSILACLIKVGKEFPSEEARQEYLKEHPKADPKKHTVEKKVGPEQLKDMGIKIRVPDEHLYKFMGDIPEYKLKIIAGEGGDITEADLRRAKSVKSQIQHGIVEAADICKESPPVCEENLGISRSHMPQIPEDSIKTLLGSDKESDRRKGQAAVDAGADPDDD